VGVREEHHYCTRGWIRVAEVKKLLSKPLKVSRMGGEYEC
jgi:hypothetical protein